MYVLSNRYPQKRAFITGAGSGLGRALAIALSKDGWTIGLADNQPKLIQETEGLVLEAGGKALPFSLDVADKDQYKEIAHQFVQQTGGLIYCLTMQVLAMDLHLKNIPSKTMNGWWE